MTSLNTRRIKRAAMMAMMFIFGILTGVGLTVLLAGRVLERYLDAPQVDGHHTLLRRAILRNVDLDAAEQRAMNEAISAHREERARLLREHELETIPIRRATFEQMREGMRPHNRLALDAYLKKLESRRFGRHVPPITEPRR